MSNNNGVAEEFASRPSSHLSPFTRHRTRSGAARRRPALGIGPARQRQRPLRGQRATWTLEQAASRAPLLLGRPRGAGGAARYRYPEPWPRSPSATKSVATDHSTVLKVKCLCVLCTNRTASYRLDHFFFP